MYHYFAPTSKENQKHPYWHLASTKRDKNNDNKSTTEPFTILKNLIRVVNFFLQRNSVAREQFWTFACCRETAFTCTRKKSV